MHISIAHESTYEHFPTSNLTLYSRVFPYRKSGIGIYIRISKLDHWTAHTHIDTLFSLFFYNSGLETALTNHTLMLY